MLLPWAAFYDDESVMRGATSCGWRNEQCYLCPGHSQLSRYSQVLIAHVCASAEEERVEKLENKNINKEEEENKIQTDDGGGVGNWYKGRGNGNRRNWTEEVENGEIIQYERWEEAKGNRFFFLIVCISGMHSSDSHHSTKPFNLTDGFWKRFVFICAKGRVRTNLHYCPILTKSIKILSKIYNQRRWCVINS